MLVKLYIYKKSTGEYLYTDVGNPNQVISDIDSNKDFTLTPPPDNFKQWRWVDGRWI